MLVCCWLWLPGDESWPPRRLPRQDDMPLASSQLNATSPVRQQLRFTLTATAAHREKTQGTRNYTESGAASNRLAGSRVDKGVAMDQWRYSRASV